MNPKVSIITPYLNASSHLGQAIDSVRAQTYPDWELLLVDDGSHDASPNIAARAARKDHRVRLASHPPGRPQGAAAARNLGLKLARGEHVAFLDADDLFMPDKLQTQIELLERFPEAAMVYGPTLWWYPHDQHRNWVETMNPLTEQLHAPPILLTRILLMLRGPVPCICAALIRRSAIVLVGGFDERFRLYEDQTLWVKIMLRFPVFVSGHVTAWYRQHPQSISAAAERAGLYHRLRSHPARRDFLDWVHEHVLATRIEYVTVKQALRLAAAVHSGDRSALTAGDWLILSAYRLTDVSRAGSGWVRRFVQRTGRNLQEGSGGDRW